MCVRVRTSKTGLSSQRVSLEVSSDSCTGWGSQYYLLFLNKSIFVFGYYGICILV